MFSRVWNWVVAATCWVLGREANEMHTDGAAVILLSCTTLPKAEHFQGAVDILNTQFRNGGSYLSISWAAQRIRLVCAFPPETFGIGVRSQVRCELYISLIPGDLSSILEIPSGTEANSKVQTALARTQSMFLVRIVCPRLPTLRAITPFLIRLFGLVLEQARLSMYVLGTAMLDQREQSFLFVEHGPADFSAHLSSPEAIKRAKPTAAQRWPDFCDAFQRSSALGTFHVLLKIAGMSEEWRWFRVVRAEGKRLICEGFGNSEIPVRRVDVYDLAWHDPREGDTIHGYFAWTDGEESSG